MFLEVSVLVRQKCGTSQILRKLYSVEEDEYTYLNFHDDDELNQPTNMFLIIFNAQIVNNDGDNIKIQSFEHAL